MILDPENLDAASIYKILIGSVVPRPIGWVSSLSSKGVANLAPFSFFTVVSRKPPMVSLTLMPHAERSSPKDTLSNIRDTREFVVNIVSFAQVNQMHRSSASYPPEVDEFDAVQLDKAASTEIAAPRVADAPVSFECRLQSVTEMGEVGDHLLIGRVVRIHVRDDIWLAESGRVDTAAFDPVGRLAAQYTLADNLFSSPVDEAFVRRSQSAKSLQRAD